MELGERIRQARLEAGLSQRQLCGDVITRNMLSQIENGTARPSMDTLRFLAERLGKNISWFLEETAVTSPNQQTMALARQAWEAGDGPKVCRLLADYRAPDPVSDAEKVLLERLGTLAAAEDAVRLGKFIFAAKLLEDLGPATTGYCAGELERRRLLLLAKVQPQNLAEICRQLPEMDGELLLRARDALDRGQMERSAALLDAAEDHTGPEWNFLRGEVYLARQKYREAVQCYHRAEEAFPEKTAVRLERCYRELEDFKQAYFYACRQRAKET